MRGGVHIALGSDDPAAPEHAHGASSLRLAARHSNAYLRSGDLLFCTKPGSVQQLVEFAKDRFRHVAIFDENDGNGQVVEVGREGYRTRSMSVFLDCYSTIHVGRLGTTARSNPSSFLSAARSDVQHRTCTYFTKGELFQAGILSIARSRSSKTASVLAYAVARRHLASMKDRESHLICSTFVARVLDRCYGATDASLWLTTEKGGDGLPSLQSYELFKHFAMPDDLWHLPLIEERFELLLDHAPVDMVAA